MFRLVVVAFAVTLATTLARADGPSAQATARFDSYISKLEARLSQQHHSPDRFVTLPGDVTRLRSGELVIEEVTPEAGTELPGAMLHHWRGTAFVPDANAVDLERELRDYQIYPQRYAPEVVSVQVLKHEGDRYQMTMRVQQKHVITIVMDTAYDVTFGRLDAHHGFSTSRSTHIAEIADQGTPQERVLSPGDEHGFLWRQNIYWSYEERDGGLFMQLESVSLSRAIPKGVGWAVGPFVKSVPKDSLEFTLRATRNELKK